MPNLPTIRNPRIGGMSSLDQPFTLSDTGLRTPTHSGKSIGDGETQTPVALRGQFADVIATVERCSFG